MSTNEADALMKKQATNQFIEELAALLNKHEDKVPIGNIVGALETTKFYLLLGSHKRFEKDYPESQNLGN